MRKFDARVIAATDRNLEEAIERRAFRPELYYRLNVHHIHVPPLRARKSDIPILVRHFLGKHGDGSAISLGADAMTLLADYDWPGNVRELENLILHILAESDDSTVECGELPPRGAKHHSERAGSRIAPGPERAGYDCRHDRNLPGICGNQPPAARLKGHPLPQNGTLRNGGGSAKVIRRQRARRAGGLASITGMRSRQFRPRTGGRCAASSLLSVAMNS